MTGKLLPFARPAPRTPKPGTVVRQETTGGGSRSHCRSTPTSSHVRSPSERPSNWRTSPGRTTPGGDASPVDDTDADGFLYADDDGPD